MKAAIIYHSADMDGIMSMEAMKWHLLMPPIIRSPESDAAQKEKVLHLYGYDYGQETPKPILKSWGDYDTIYIVDLTVEELMDNLALRPKIVWIDHHKTAIEKYKFAEFKGVRLDGVAACRLVWWWNTTMEGEPRLDSFRLRLYTEPAILTLLGEYDVWDHHDENSLLANLAMQSIPAGTWKDTVRLLFNGEPNTLKGLVAGGKIIAYYLKNVSARYAFANAHEVVFHGLKFLVLNGARGSQAFDAVLNVGELQREDIDGLMAWTYDGDDVSVSLYGVPGKDIDLSEIALEYGGGGHRGACGFRMALHDMADLFFNQPIPEGEKISEPAAEEPSSALSPSSSDA
jgi:hypothetical protein